MTPKRIPIPSDIVLKVTIHDLYDENADEIDITDVEAIKLTFSAGGASKIFEISPSESANNTPGVTLVSPEGNDGGDPHIIVCLCTGELLPGQLILRSEVSISDNRFHDNVRTEVDEYTFPIILA